MLALGAAYMLGLAWRTLCSSSRLEERKGGAGFLDGMLLQFVNVKVIIYGVTSPVSYTHLVPRRGIRRPLFRGR